MLQLTTSETMCSLTWSVDHLFKLIKHFHVAYIVRVDKNWKFMN